MQGAVVNQTRYLPTSSVSQNYLPDKCEIEQRFGTIVYFSSTVKEPFSRVTADGEESLCASLLVFVHNSSHLICEMLLMISSFHCKGGSEHWQQLTTS